MPRAPVSPGVMSRKTGVNSALAYWSSHDPPHSPGSREHAQCQVHSLGKVRAHATKCFMHAATTSSADRSSGMGTRFRGRPVVTCCTSCSMPCTPSTGCRTLLQPGLHEARTDARHGKQRWLGHLQVGGHLKALHERYAHGGDQHRVLAAAFVHSRES